jgi:hypothetical protein
MKVRHQGRIQGGRCTRRTVLIPTIAESLIPPHGEVYLIQHLCKFISDLQHVDGILQVQSNLYSTAAAKFPVPVHNDSYITVTGRHFIGKHGSRFVHIIYY